MTGGAAAGGVGTIVRPVRPDEADAVGRLVVDAYRSLLGPGLDDGYAAELADVAGRMRAATALVAVRGTALLGHVTYVPDSANPLAEQVLPGEAAIRMLAVAPSGQGAGTGRLLVEDSIGRARRAGRDAVFLHSTPEMVAAHRLYGSLGFVQVPARDWEPAPGLLLLAFRLALPA